MGEGQAGRTALRCPLPETRERRTEEPRGEDPAGPVEGRGRIAQLVRARL